MSDWIPLEDATRRYGLSRATLYRLIGEGQVARGKRAGDKRAYVSSADVKKATTIRVLAPGGSSRRRAKTRARRRV